MVRGPMQARALLHASAELNGQHLLTWSVGSQDSKERTLSQTVEFFPWNRRFPMTETEPLIFKTWELLMSKLPDIMEVRDHETHDRAKNEARGIAQVLAIQMTPFMESADHVVRCAVKKYKDPSFEVPGLGEHLWNPMFNPDGSTRTSITTSKPVKTKPAARPKVDNKSTKKLTEKEADGIREAVSSGLFSEEDVAAMFKVSLATVKEALKD